VKTWVYVLDEFKPARVKAEDALRLMKEDPMRLLRLVNDLLPDMIRGARSVRVYDVYTNPHTSEALVEYIVNINAGSISVKVIVSDNPARTLRDYYVYEARTRRSGFLLGARA